MELDTPKNPQMGNGFANLVKKTKPKKRGRKSRKRGRQWKGKQGKRKKEKVQQKVAKCIN